MAGFRALTEKGGEVVHFTIWRKTLTTRQKPESMQGGASRARGLWHFSQVRGNFSNREIGEAIFGRGKLRLSFRKEDNSIFLERSKKKRSGRVPSV